MKSIAKRLGEERFFSGAFVVISINIFYFSCVLFGGKRIFRIFAGEQGVAVMYASDGEKNNRKNGFYV